MVNNIVSTRKETVSFHMFVLTGMSGVPVLISQVCSNRCEILSISIKLSNKSISTGQSKVLRILH